jgi:FKBP-type peptidyl-prolyl cis-trans isomerase (trigger factor)
MNLKAKSRFWVGMQLEVTPIRIRHFIGLALMMATFLIACGRNSADIPQTELIRVGESRISVREFKQIRDMAQDYSWQEGNPDANESASKDLRLLDQITEELLIKEYAKACNIEVTKSEVDAAVQNIKSDYPEDTFEQVLLENAVPYDFWRKRLAVRLLIDKVIEKELENHVVITPEDISSYYQKHYGGKQAPQSTQKPLDKSDDINQLIVKRLRKLKAEKAYKNWIQGLQKSYPVRVNWEAWKQLIKSN